MRADFPVEGGGHFLLQKGGRDHQIRKDNED